jgi:hypothetical protein
VPPLHLPVEEALCDEVRLDLDRVLDRGPERAQLGEVAFGLLA